MLPIDGVSVGDLPSVMVFWGSPRSGTIHFRLELASYASLLSAFFCRVLSGPVCPFQFQALERWLELLPSSDCEAHSAGKRSFASYAKRHLQLDASSHLLDAAAFNRCILSPSLELASRRLPVLPFWSPFPLLWSVVHPFGAIPRLGGWGSAPALFLCHALCDLVGSHDFSLGWIAYIALSCQTQQLTDRMGRDTCWRDETEQG
jgi:hypothetical protein